MKKSFEKKGLKDKKLLDVASCLIQTYIQKVCFILSNNNNNNLSDFSILHWNLWNWEREKN